MFTLSTFPLHVVSPTLASGTSLPDSSPRRRWGVIDGHGTTRSMTKGNSKSKKGTFYSYCLGREYFNETPRTTPDRESFSDDNR